MCYCSNSNAGGTYTKVRVESALRLLTLLTKVLLPLLLRIMPHHKFDALSLSYIHTPDGTLRKVGTVTVGRGEVSWCFMPSQPVWLYQGNGEGVIAKKDARPRHRWLRHQV